MVRASRRGHPDRLVEDEGETEIVIVSPPTRGNAVVRDGELEYTPDSDFVGEATMEVAVLDDGFPSLTSETVTLRFIATADEGGCNASTRPSGTHAALCLGDLLATASSRAIVKPFSGERSRFEKPYALASSL